MSYVYDYPTNLSLYSFGFSDPDILRSLSQDSDPLFSSTSSSIPRNSSPPSHRHDGTSPLPLGMDWSPPPTTWNGRQSLWPHDPHTGWSYCVTIPSWIILPSSSGSDPAVFYKVQVAVQSPEGITTIRGILRRFNNFLKLFSDLKSEFPKKRLPPAPAKTLLRMKNKDYLEERRHALEDWMEKLLSDIDVSRNVHVAIFLELEAAARSSFYDSNQIDANENLQGDEVDISNHTNKTSGASSPEAGLLVVSNSGKSSVCDQSEIGRQIQIRDDDIKVGSENSLYNQDSTCELKKTVRDSSSEQTDDQNMSNSDMEDLIARLNQEVAVKNYLTEKVKDLEVELETTKQTAKENLHRVVQNEGEELAQMKKDAEDFKRNFVELELKLKAEQDDKMLMESTKSSVIQQNKILQQELNVTQEKLDILLKHQEELELKSKSDIKLLIKEVKCLRSCQLELKDEVSRLMKEKIEGERVLQLEKQKRESANAGNLKLLHECEVLLNHLKDCSINIHIEGDKKFTLDTSSPSDAIDLLTTCDNQIDLLLEEAQTLSHDVEDNKAAEDNIINGTKPMTSDDELRLMLTSIFIDNARLRKQVNSVIRCAISSFEKAGDSGEVEEEASLSSGNTQLK